MSKNLASAAVVVGAIRVNSYPAKISLLLLIYSNALQTNLIMEASTMNHDQTAPKRESDLGPYCLQ